MSTISDNTATSAFGSDHHPSGLAKMDSARSTTYPRSFEELFRNSEHRDGQLGKYGLGVTNPNEMAHLFELMAQARRSILLPTQPCSIFWTQYHDFMLQRYVEGARAAHKDGETDAVRTECTLWYLRNRVVACVMTKENKDQRWSWTNELSSRSQHGLAIINCLWRSAAAPPSS